MTSPNTHPIQPVVDPEDDFADDNYFECHECGGEGWVSSCDEPWACLSPEEGCDYCTHRCSVCRPSSLLSQTEGAR